MNGNVATYTATLTMPLSVTQVITGSGSTAQIIATGTLRASGTFQFDFGPRIVYWNASSGDFSAGSNWDVGFAPRTGDTAAIQNGGASTLSTTFLSAPAAVWVGNGAATSGTLTIAAGGRMNCDAVVLGQNAGTGTLILGGGTLMAPSIVQGAGGNGSLYFDAGTLQATANSNQFLAGLSAVYLRAGGATIDSNGFSVSMNQALDHDPGLGATPDGGLLKTGSGILTSCSSNTYTGGTIITAGTLQLGDGAVNNGSVQGNVTDSGVLVFADPFAQTYSGQISGGGSLAKTGTGTLILSGSDTYSGGTRVDAGTLIATGNNSLPAGGSLTVGAGGTLIFDSSQTSAPASTISPVPEPRTLVLLAAGVLAAFAAWRRRRP
jgi:autotransporter-associated beta strand protein